MKIRINYDFFDRIKNAKEDKPTVFTVVRNNKKLYLINASLLGAVDAFGVLFTGLSTELIPHLLLDVLLISLNIEIGYTCALLFYILNGYNGHQLNAQRDLTSLIQEFRKLNLNTDYNLLLKTELYKKEYKLKFNESGIPYILEKKFYNIPAYTFNNEVKTRSVLEEHKLGSKNYDLSIDEPEKKLKLVPAIE